MNQYRILFLILCALNPSSIFSQDVLIANKEKRKVPINHSIGFGLTNAVTFPEKITERLGPIELKPFPKYGFEFFFRYNIWFYNKIGLEVEMVAGALGEGDKIVVVKPLTPHPKLPPDYAEEISSTSTGTGTLHGGLNLRVFSRNRLTQHVDIVSKLGLKIFLQTSGTSESGYAVSNQPNYYRILNYSDTKNRFLPDVQGGFDFLIHPKKPQHNFVVGCYVNASFVSRASGNYTFSNIGPENFSSGNISYTSSYFGISVAYQFDFGKRSKSQKERKPKEERIKFSIDW